MKANNIEICQGQVWSTDPSAELNGRSVEIMISLGRYLKVRLVGGEGGLLTIYPTILRTLVKESDLLIVNGFQVLPDQTWVYKFNQQYVVSIVNITENRNVAVRFEHGEVVIVESKNLVCPIVCGSNKEKKRTFEVTIIAETDECDKFDESLLRQYMYENFNTSDTVRFRVPSAVIQRHL